VEQERRSLLTGYTDRLSVAPGETLDFMVSSDEPKYSVTVVRLFHGDRNPDGPGFKQEEIEASVNGEYAGRRQRTHPGSYGLVEGIPALGAAIGLSAWIFPTTPDLDGRQCVAFRRTHSGTGFGLFIEDSKLLLLVDGPDAEPQRLALVDALEARQWYFVYAGFDAGGGATLESRRSSWPFTSGHATAELAPAAAGDGASTLHLAASGYNAEAGLSDPFNGRIASPALFRRTLSEEEREGLARPEASELASRAGSSTARPQP
jgi:N,N-dimethylformamidase